MDDAVPELAVKTRIPGPAAHCFYDPVPPAIWGWWRPVRRVNRANNAYKALVSAPRIAVAAVLDSRLQHEAIVSRKEQP